MSLTRDFLMDDSDDDGNWRDKTGDVVSCITSSGNILSDTTRDLSKKTSDSREIEHNKSKLLAGILETCDRVCPYAPCKAYLKSNIDISRHILQYHITEIHRCSTCQRLFPCQADLTLHEQTHFSPHYVNATSHIGSQLPLNTVESTINDRTHIPLHSVVATNHNETGMSLYTMDASSHDKTCTVLYPDDSTRAERICTPQHTVATVSCEGTSLPLQTDATSHDRILMPLKTVDTTSQEYVHVFESPVSIAWNNTTMSNNCVYDENEPSNNDVIRELDNQTPDIPCNDSDSHAYKPISSCNGPDSSCNGPDSSCNGPDSSCTGHGPSCNGPNSSCTGHGSLCNGPDSSYTGHGSSCNGQEKQCEKSVRNNQFTNTFLCPHCTNTYSHLQTLRVHVFYKHFDFTHDCLYYKTQNADKSLYLRWHDAQRFRCSHCLFPFARNSHKLKHNLKKCKKINVNNCSLCSRKFYSVDLLNKHIELKACFVTQGSVTSKTTDTNICKACDRNFTSKSYFKCQNHISEKSYKCTVIGCNKGFVKRTQLNLHKLCHTGAKPESCDKCEAKFRYKVQLKQHQISHLNGKFKKRYFRCLYCDKNYKFLCSLKSHVFQIHFDTTSPFLYFDDPRTNKQYYIKPHDTNVSCAECSKRFETRVKLDQHWEEKHGNCAKSYACDECHVGFTSFWMLTQHKRSKVHNPTRHHMCPVCKSQFHTKAALSSHTIVHNTEKPFQCSVCGKTFARKNQLQRHNLTHSSEKRHQCPECGKTFSVVYDMKRHMVIHSTDRVKAYRCSHCDKGYNKKSQLLHHCKSRHS